jgi:hypothetical protein
MSIQVKDAAGANQTINTLPPTGSAFAQDSLPVVPAPDQQPCVGAMNFATAQANVGTAATLIVDMRAGPSGSGRVAVTIYNNGSATIYLGGAGVTTSNGLPLVAGASITINAMAAVYGIAASGSQNVGTLETF